MLSTNFKFSKLQLQKSLFEEYKVTAAEILFKLEEILEKYAVYCGNCKSCGLTVGTILLQMLISMQPKILY